jgi:membrane protein
MELLPKVDWKAFFRSLYNKITETDVFNHSAQVAFYFSFAFFPLLLFLVSLFGLVLNSTDNLRAELYQYLAQIMPSSAYDLVQKTMDEIIQNSTTGKVTLGLFVTLWSASAGVDSLRDSLNDVYEESEKRPWWHTKLLSVVLTFLFILLLAIALGTATVGWQLLETAVGVFGYQISSPWVLSVLQWSVIAFVMVFATAVVYSWLPSFKEFKWVWISPGAVVAIILWVILTSGFRVYLQYFNSYNKTYGSLGAVIILMLWMYLTGMALLIGGAINSVLTEMTDGNKEESNNEPAAA